MDIYYNGTYYTIFQTADGRMCRADYPFASKMAKNKLRKAFEKQYSKGKINYHSDDKDNFIIDQKVYQLC